MRTEDVLAATATGIWRWDNASGTVILDAEAARLLGLSGGAGGYTASAVRSLLHPVDWNEVSGTIGLAVAEGTLAESRVRVVDAEGRVLRTIRSRSKPEAEGDGYRLFGTVQEVPEPQPGTSAHTPVIGDWRRSREAFLLDAGRALAEARSTAEVLRVAASLSMPGFSPDGLAVFGVEADRLTVVGYHGYDEHVAGPLADLPIETEYPVSEVIRTGRALYVPTPLEYRRRYPAMWPLIEGYGRQSWAFLPLIVSGRTMGTWMAAFSHPVAFTPDERSVLATVARMLAQALTRAGVAESERELSRGLQRSMMPSLGPGIPGMSVAARYVPTGGGLQVGGDWYDLIPLPGASPAAEPGGGRIALVIGDVQGHDVRAAGLMGQLRTALRAYATEGHRPDAVLARASRFLAGLHDYTESEAYDDGDPVGGHSAPRFATCLYLECDPATGTIEVARAGHPDPAIRLADGTVILRPTAGGLPLGIDPDSDYPTTQIVLEPGETIMICTDGLLETGGHDLDSGWERIRAVLEEHRDEAGSLEKLADALVQAVHGPASHHTTGPLSDRREDDIAVVLLSRHGRPARRAPRRTVLTVRQAEPERISTARRQMRDLLYDWADEEQVDSAVLMVSEMVTNVLVHTDGDALLVAEAIGRSGRRRLRVEVSDTSDELPHQRRPGELASSGRGLLLMELLADVWGVDPRGEGKSVWFELYEPGSGDGPPEPVPPGPCVGSPTAP